MKKATDDLVHLSLDLARLLRRTAECGVGDVNVLRLHALGAIGDHERLTMTEFAKTMSISPSTATEFADRLMRRGLIRRVTDSTNRRTVLITLTPLGQTIVQKGMRQKQKLLGDMFAGLSAQDRAHLLRIFRILLHKKP